MTFDRTDRTGFAPHRCERGQGRRSTMLAQLVTSTALVLSIAVAATAVSIGIARADVIGTAGSGDGTALALVIGLFVSTVGGILAAHPQPD